MPYRKAFFKKNNPVHILSRAVEGTKIFIEKADCYRFIFQLHAANLGSPAPNLKRRDIIKEAQSLLYGKNISSDLITNHHPPFVQILDFSLTINHYHLHLIPDSEDSTPLFMKKLNLGFAKYFNLRHNRKGSLFGSRYKSILINSEKQLAAVSRYISIINPLDVYQPGWREKGLKNWKEALRFLENYEFSSFPDKVGRRNSSILAPKKIRKRYSWEENFSDRQEYLKFAESFLKENIYNTHRDFFGDSVLE